ncbi:MAG: hypothetical protein LBI64_07645 [Coriobacteriales bacterium]|nr:hypothetical protein [Coriobacteriales bacterium]
MTENEAFARMEELMAQLPAMEQRGLKLARARAAREVLALAEHAEVLEQESANYTAIYKAALAAAEAAHEAQDAQTEARDLGKARAHAELIAVRRAPLERAWNAHEQALGAGGFPNEEEARTAALTDVDFAALEQEVEDFRREYTEVFELCQNYDTTEKRDAPYRPEN